MPLWRPADPLVLASKSQARRLLLEAAGIPVDAYPAELDERGLEASVPPASSPALVAALLARQKASVVAGLHSGQLVLGADQILVLGERRFAKPPDRAAAKAQLRALSGHTHTLHSAVALMQDATVLFEYVGTARLTMRLFSDDFLELYLDAVGGEACASVGAYQVEHLGIQLFDRIEGDYFTVLGLPVLAVLDFLRRRGWLMV